MSDNTNIEWAHLGLGRGASWNPIRARSLSTGKIGWHCERVSDGCSKCYASSINEHRFGTGLPYKPGHRKDVEIYLDEKTLLEPLRWRVSRGVFVCSMTDLFGDWVSDEWIDRIIAVMALCPQHRFAVLTKRSARMRAYMSDAKAPARIARVVLDMLLAGTITGAAALGPLGNRAFEEDPEFVVWPLLNLWLMISAEDQQRADERIPDLLATPAAVRGVSFEPLLGAIEWRPEWNALNWSVCGGESGPGARPMHPAWARSIRDACAVDGVAYFHKQNGEFSTTTIHNDGRFDPPIVPFSANNLYRWDGDAATRVHPKENCARTFALGVISIRVGKRHAGRLLDGREHNDFPEVTR
jgi:protein gp37